MDCDQRVGKTRFKNFRGMGEPGQGLIRIWARMRLLTRGQEVPFSQGDISLRESGTLPQLGSKRIRGITGRL